MRHTIAILLGVAALALGACGSQFSEVCQAASDCEDGNDEDVRQCVNEADTAEELAANYACDQEFDAYATCAIEEGDCDDDRWRIDDCDDEEEDYEDCMRDARDDADGDG